MIDIYLNNIQNISLLKLDEQYDIIVKNTIRTNLKLETLEMSVRNTKSFSFESFSQLSDSLLHNKEDEKHDKNTHY